MKRMLMFLFAFFLAFTQVNGKDLKSASSSLKSQKTIDIASDLCIQLLVHKESNLWFSVTNWGFLGSEMEWQDDSETGLPAPSAEFPGGSGLEYLFQGAIWVGGIVEGETLVSVGVDGWLWVN